MTVHALLVDPPRDGLVLPSLAETAPLTESEAAGLYAAMVKDAMRAVSASGGDLLVNYRPNDLLPEEHRGRDVEAVMREHAESALDDVDEVRFEVQVGSSFEARAGNSATHLLREEDVASVAILDGKSPTLSRPSLDSAAMKLRRHGAVLGPAPAGRVSYLGLTDPIDFEGAFTPPELPTLAAHAGDAGLDVDFLPMHPAVETGDDLLTLLAVLDARRSAGRAVPESTAAFLDEVGLHIVEEDGDRRLER